MKDRGFIIGVDLAQSTDWTAILIAQIFQVDEGPKEVNHVHLRHLERLPKNTTYTDQAERLAALRFNSPSELRLDQAPMVVDSTGVGRAVVDLLRDRGLDPTPVTFTAGDRASFDDDLRGHRVPKKNLVSALRVLLEKGRLKLAHDLPDLDILLDELRDFELQVTASGNLTFNARRGSHDDTVAALSLICWWALEHGPVSWGRDSVRHVKRRGAVERPAGGRGMWKEGSNRGRWS